MTDEYRSIADLVSLLRSSKIKDRNKALNDLEDLTQSSGSLSSKNYKLIIQGLFSLIDTETILLLANKTKPTEARISRGANTLRILVEKSLKGKTTRLKFKGYLEIVFSAMAKFFINGEIFYPSALDLAKTINVITSSQFFKDYLMKDDWEGIFLFLLKSIDALLVKFSESFDSNTHEKLAVELFSTLQSFLNCDKDISVTSVRLYERNNYLRLVSFLARVSTFYKKETTLIISVFRIVNKLIIVLETEDVNTVKVLIHVGMRLLIKYHQSQLNPIQDQILIFINLEAVHNFIDFAPENLDQNISDEANDSDDSEEVSIRSDIYELNMHFLKDEILFDDDLLYILGSSLQNLFKIFESSDFEIQREDIGLNYSETESSGDWFTLNGFYLRSGKHKPWLLARGFAKTLTSYYKVRKCINDRKEKLLDTYDEASSKSISHKKQKVGGIVDILKSSESPLEFCHELINNKLDPKSQKHGLVVIAFLFSSTSILNYNSTAFGYESKIDSYETTDLFNSSSFSNEVTDMVYSNSLEIISNCFENSSLIFWSLLASKTYLFTAQCQNISEQDSTCSYSKLMQIVLPLVKDEFVGRISSSVVYMIHSCYGEELDYDPSLLMNISNMIDLSEINGPFTMNQESFLFWISINSISKDIPLKRKIMGQKIQDWLLAKWDLSMKGIRGNPSFLGSFQQLLEWLCGRETHYTLENTPRVSSIPYDEAWIFESNFLSHMYFISRRQSSSKVSVSSSIYMGNLEDPVSLEPLIIRMLDTSKYLHSLGKEELIFQWSLFLSNIKEVLTSEDHSEHLLTSISYQISIDSEFLQQYNLSSESFELVYTFNRLDIDVSDETISSKITRIVPLTKFLNSCLSLTESTCSKEPDTSFAEEQIDENHSLFEDEFKNFSSTTNERVHPKRIIPYCISNMKRINSVELLKFIISISRLKKNDENWVIGVIISYLEELKVIDVLYCFNYLNLQFQSHLLSLEKISFTNLIKLIRVLGEGPLVDSEIDRSEFTLITVARFLRLLFPVLSETPTDDLKNDLGDICAWLIQCGQKEVIQTFNAYKEFNEFSLVYGLHGQKIKDDSDDIISLYFQKFFIEGNSIKIALSSGLVTYLQCLRVEDQMETYKFLLSRFTGSEKNFEKSSTYVLFLCELSHCSEHIMVSVLFNIIQCSKEVHFEPYLYNAIRYFCKLTHAPTPKVLLQKNSLELILYWVMFDDVNNFPSRLFGYSDQKDFFEEFYKEISAILIATFSGNQTGALVESLFSVKLLDMATLVRDSLHLIIPLAYVQNGARNKVFDLIKSFLNSEFKTLMIEKLFLIVLKIIEFTDVSDGKQLSSLFDDSSLRRVLSSESSLENIGSFKVVAISLNSSLDLIDKLTEKYSMNGGFWDEKRLYFFIRRISLKLKSLTDDMSIIAEIRRIKLVLWFCLHVPLSVHIIKLLISIMYPLLNHKVVYNDALAILLFSVNGLKTLKYQLSLPLVVKILSGLLVTDESLISGTIQDSLKEYIAALNEHLKVVPILDAVMAILESKSVGLSVASIEDLLNSNSDYHMCLLDGNSEYIAQIISEVFERVDTYNEKGRLFSVVKVLLGIDFKNTKLKRKFTLWSARYISNHYLYGGFMDGLSQISPKNCSDEKTESNNFEVQTMDPIIQNIEECMLHTDPSISACAESVLGALLKKYESSKKDMSNFLRFESQFIKYQEFVLSMDINSCAILNSEDSIFQLPETNLSLFFNKLTDQSHLTVEEWSSKLLTSMLESLSAYTTIAPIVSIFYIKFPQFSKDLLPFAMCYYLHFIGKDSLSVMKKFFANLLQLAPMSPDHAKVFVNSVLHLRIGMKYKLQYFEDIYKSIPLYDVFKIAVKSKLYKSALLIFEDLHSESKNDFEWFEFKDELLESYEAIDDTDLFYGLPEEPSLDYSYQLISRSINNFDKFNFDSGLLDTNLSLGLPTSASKVLTTMNEFGMYGISTLLGNNQSYNFDQNDDETYERAWKLNQWNLIPPKESSENKLVYNILCQIRENPLSSKKLLSDCMAKTLMRKEEALSSFANQTAVSWFRILGILNGLYDIFEYNSSSLTNQLKDFYEEFSAFDIVDVKTSESILLTRKTVLQSFAESKVALNDLSNDELWIGTIIDLVRYNDRMRKDGQKQKMISSMMMIDNIVNSNILMSKPALKNKYKNWSKYQIACSLWEQGQTSTPVLIFKDLIKNSGVAELISSSFIQAKLVGWMADSRQELASDIMDQFVTPIIPEVQYVQGTKQRARTYSLLAQFCDKQSKSRSLDDEIKKLERRVANKKAEIEELKDHYGKTYVSADEKKTVQKYYTNLKSQYMSEKTEYELRSNQRREFACNAVHLYLKSILFDDEVDEDLDRFFALWLEQSSNDDLNTTIAEEIYQMPTHKVVNWSSQLISRLSANDTKFQDLLGKLVIRICVDHPFHSLYYLISLRLQESMSPLSQPKQLGESLWSSLTENDEFYVHKIMLPIEKFCFESVKLAEHKVSRGKALNLASINKFNYWLHDLPNIPLPTRSIPVSKIADYTDAPLIEKIEPKISIATSGLSLPKIATFFMNNGDKHKVLLKHGTDDLKQDAIMEQVFERVNVVLSKDKATQKRNLRVRTYKPIPLGPKAGIIEFVANSIALIEVIKPYHVNKNEMKLDKAKELMRKSQTKNRSERIQVYNSITDQITPVLKYFFLDNFLTPEKWFDSKNLYTRGVATTSMIGHILGLGDRHCNNILLDSSTGEPIHIDLGVAFDQGKRLPIPETVPFRLTRDIVDGFGVVGTNGVFTKSCEHTFRVLRDNKDHILSILDVLRWDPLYSWSISPLRKKKLQSALMEIDIPQYEEDGSEAGRSIATVSDKIAAGGLSVEASVRELIQEATNPQNLALIYFGWCPFY